MIDFVEKAVKNGTDQNLLVISELKRIYGEENKGELFEEMLIEKIKSYIKRVLMV